MDKKTEYEKLLENYKEFREESYKKQWDSNDEMLEASKTIDELLMIICDGDN